MSEIVKFETHEEMELWKAVYIRNNNDLLDQSKAADCAVINFRDRIQSVEQVKRDSKWNLYPELKPELGMKNHVLASRGNIDCFMLEVSALHDGDLWCYIPNK